MKTTGVDKSIQGVLWEAKGEFLVVKNASLLEAGRDPITVDGEVIIERRNVDFVQLIPARMEV